MVKEIGSEFWNVPQKHQNIKFLLSGRTALEYIIREILSGCKADSVLLPSYCCHTMIEPFVRHGISIRFYDVYFDETLGLCADIPEPKKNEIFYYMTYFGTLNLQGINVGDIRRKWRFIIDDSTHSWMSKRAIRASGSEPLTGLAGVARQIGSEEDADYRFISFRKWTGLDAIAVAVKKDGQFQTESKKCTNKQYCDKRNLAFSLKNAYMSGESQDKAEFLTVFNEAEEMLEEDYVGYRPSIDTIEKLSNLDISFIKRKHRENAAALIAGLNDISGIHLVFEKIDECETPLFIPILIPEGRDGLRKFLIDNQVYCPVHWPLSEYHVGLSQRGKEIYAMELSLVCDQRYSVEDMERVVKLIRQYFAKER